MGSEAPRCGGGVWYFSTDYSLHILSFNNPAIQYFPTFPKILNILPNSYTLKTFEESSKKSQKIIEPRTPTKLRHFFIKWNLR